MIAVIRIHGRVNLDRDIVETLQRLNLRHKFNCVVFEKPTPIQLGMIKKVKDFVAYGNIDKDTHDKLVKTRGKKGKKVFRLHPPRGGASTKKHFGVNGGILGNNREEINKLIRRML